MSSCQTQMCTWRWRRQGYMSPMSTVEIGMQLCVMPGRAANAAQDLMLAGLAVTSLQTIKLNVGGNPANSRHGELSESRQRRDSAVSLRAHNLPSSSKRPRTSTQTDSATPAGDDWLREDLSECSYGDCRPILRSPRDPTSDDYSGRQQSAEPLVLPPTHQLYQPALPLPAHTQPHHQPIASTSTSTRFPEPVAHPPPRPPNTLFDHADPSPSDGSDGRDRLPTQPSPATGGFSLKKLLGGRSERPRHSLADAFAVDESPAEVNEAPKQYQDITMAGIVPEHSVPQLFDL